MVLISWVLGCTGAECGEGTELVDGVCVAVEDTGPEADADSDADADADTDPQYNGAREPSSA